jgi:hypothetical protein
VEDGEKRNEHQGTKTPRKRGEGREEKEERPKTFPATDY